MKRECSLNPEVLDTFRTMLPRESQGAFGHNPSRWAQWVASHSRSNSITRNMVAKLPNRLIARADLYAMLRDPESETAQCVLAILAWGGMRRTSGATALSGMHHWLKICEKIRAGGLSREKAYRSLSEKRAMGNMKGMGPAFFTKLIFFFMHGQRGQGLIMDQWTAASVNLLAGCKIVATTKSRAQDGRLVEIVCDRNTEENYGRFCRTIEIVADRCGVDPVTAELAMFSEGRGKGAWRNYLIAKRSSASPQ